MNRTLDVDYKETPMVQVMDDLERRLNMDSRDTVRIRIAEGMAGEGIRAAKLTVQAKSIRVRDLLEGVAKLVKCEIRYRRNEVELRYPLRCDE